MQNQHLTPTMTDDYKSSTTTTKTLLFAGAMAVVVFMTSFTAITPNVQTAAAVALPAGQWEIHKNGYIGTLSINSVGADGVVTGTLEAPPDPPHDITGLYNERTGTLTFYRIINPQDPASIQTYVGIVFRDGSPFAGTPDRLAGYFIGLPAGGGNSEQNVWGWYANLISPQEAPSSAEQAEQNNTSTTGETAGIIGPETPPGPEATKNLTEPNDTAEGFFGDQQPVPP
jgi:hypothetical protein